MKIILIIYRINNENSVFNGLVFFKIKGKLQIGKNIKINSSIFKNVIGGDTRTSFVVNKNARIVIGDNVRISNSAFYCNNEIIIDDYVMIGGSCKIWDSDFHPLNPIERMINPNENFNSSKIHIKKNAFIGGMSIILKGVTIGENSIVAAGSVVSKSIPSNEIWGGNPAKFIKKIHD